MRFLRAHYNGIAVVLFIASFVLACNTDTRPDPAVNARAWFEAVNAVDTARVLDLTCEASIDRASLAKNTGQVRVDPAGMKFETVEKSGDRAKVHITGESKVIINGIAQTSKADSTMTMHFERGDWRHCKET